ncbi:MAG: hypothetical protein ACJA07_004136 [Rhodococcus sp. (in: high G+C Gram-positive bacteria)]|jgi:hypothetical protein
MVGSYPRSEHVPQVGGFPAYLLRGEQRSEINSDNSAAQHISRRTVHCAHHITVCWSNEDEGGQGATRLAFL